MNEIKPFIIALALLTLGYAGVVSAAPSLQYMRTLLPVDSTENIGTSTAKWDEGWFNSINVGSCTGCSGGGFSFPFTKQAGGEQATSTTLGFFNGFLSLASSTIRAQLNLPLLSDGGLGVFGGQVISGATTTAGTGLTYSGNAFNVNTIQNIAKLSNLTSNGFVKTSGGDGTLSVDTATYLSSIGSGTNGQLAYWGGTNNLGSVATGTISSSGGITTTAGRSAVGGALSIACDVASGSIPGCLSAADWTTFNGKLGAMTFAYPFSSFADWGTHNATSSLIGFRAGLYSTASSTIGAGGAGTGLTIFGGATTTGQLLVLGSTTLQNFTGTNATMASTTVTGAFLAGNATTSNLYLPSGFITGGGTASAPAGYISATTSPSFFIASTTKGIENRGYGAGTSTFPVGKYREPRIIRTLSCFATSTAPAGYNIRFRAGDTFSSQYFCDNNNRTISVGFTIPKGTQFFTEMAPASTTADYANPTWDWNKLAP